MASMDIYRARGGALIQRPRTGMESVMPRDRGRAVNERAPRTALLPVIACLAAAALVAGCAGAPPETPTPKPGPPAKPPPRTALDLPARVIPALPAPPSPVGTIGGKKLYSVGGERWLVDDAGRTERETVSLGDRLENAFSYSQAGLSAVGWNSQHAYTFPDILGAPKALVATRSPFTHVRPGPGALLVFTLFSGTAVDLSTGLEKGGFFPAFPLRDAMFVDGARGAVATGIGGVGVTTDGGKTWRPVHHKARIHPTLDLFADGKDIYLKEAYSHRVARLDLDGAEVGDWVEKTVLPERPNTPIEQWITQFGHPLSSAVENGIDAGDNTGIVAWNDTASRVDLATGLFVESVRFDGMGTECRGAMAGKEAYLVCGTTGKRGPNEQLWRVKTDGPLAMEKVHGGTFGGPGTAEILGTGAGGLLVFQGCVDQRGDYCVRQPNGTFVQVERTLVPYIAVTPLSDGRIASVGVRVEGAGPIVELVASSARERKVLAEAKLDAGVQVAAERLDQPEDGVIRFVVRERTGGKERLSLYAHEIGKPGFRRTALPDGDRAVLRDGVLLVLHKDSPKIAVSHDFGVTFKDLDLPNGPAQFKKLTRLGVQFSQYTRVGWAPLPASPDASWMQPVRLIEDPIPTVKETMDLACKGGATKKGVAMPRSPTDAPSAFGIKPPPKGTSRFESGFTGYAPDGGMLLDVEGPTPNSGGGEAQAEKWTLHWIDPGELSAKARSLSVKAPSPVLAVTVQAAWVQEGKLAFTCDIAGKRVLVRTKGSGLETAEIDRSLVPSIGAPLAFSADGGVVAYLAGDVLVVWKSGDDPRPIASVSQSQGVLIGAPTKEGVAVFADVQGQSYHRVFPMPTDKAPPLPQEAVVSPAWDGWTRSVTLLGGSGEVRFCDAKAAGDRFHSTSYGPSLWIRMHIDGGVPSSTSTVRYDAVSDGKSFCVKGLTAFLSKDWGRDAIPAAPGTLDVLRIRQGKSQITRYSNGEAPPLRELTCGPESSAK